MNIQASETRNYETPLIFVNPMVLLGPPVLAREPKLNRLPASCEFQVSLRERCFGNMPTSQLRLANRPKQQCSTADWFPMIWFTT